MSDRLLPRSGSGESDDFRSRVIGLARELYPEIAFEPHASSPEVILVGEIQIGLHNLQAKYAQSGQSEGELRELILAHFELVLDDKAAKLTFEVAEKRLRPQLMPPEFAQRVPLVAFPFGHSLAIGLVLDQKQAYAYVTRDDAARWGKSDRELLERALGNLEELSDNLPLQGGENGEMKLIALQTKDSFDAVRVLLPGLQEFLAERLGRPFYFGIPNRDFLICWNGDAPAEFAQSIRAQLRNDFGSQPYPLSPRVFTFGADGVITEE